ncbi:Low molecular weight protein tyrosine phosphatase (EC [uncultured Gammaproteobacteria bacterium]|nr:Low molecular weight protein tyrosine phosphatase (EC 3.1.3.48) [uncultured Gammaproteobacteria bacterium]VVH66060.1 Low molecular weight protein tyrosine phosphatase (EC [uncultured Gammaproteobacteria bacterium]
MGKNWILLIIPIYAKVSINKNPQKWFLCLQFINFSHKKEQAF